MSTCTEHCSQVTNLPMASPEVVEVVTAPKSRSLFTAEQSRSEEDNDISMKSELGTKDGQLPPVVTSLAECLHRCSHCSHVFEHQCDQHCTSTIKEELNQQQCDSSQAKNEWIKLNVGGTCFQTTRTTLCSDRNSFFYRLCQEDNFLKSDKVILCSYSGSSLNTINSFNSTTDRTKMEHT